MVGSKRQQTPLFLTSISPSPPTQSPPRKRTIHQYGKKGKELKRRSRFGGSEPSESEHDLANFDFDDEHGIPNQDMDEDTDGRSHPNEDEDVQVSKQEEMERKIVGRLMGNYKGRQCRLRIVLGRISRVGSGTMRECNWVIAHPKVAKMHFSLYGTRTTSTLSNAVLQDHSTIGLIINGKFRPPVNQAEFKSKIISSRQIVLQDQDTIEFPNVPGRLQADMLITDVKFTYHHNTDCHPPESLSINKVRPGALFMITDVNAKIRKYTIYNNVLGSGAFGIVYLASTTTGFPLQVAAKLCCADRREGTKRREIDTLKMINHPNIQALLDVVPLQSENNILILELVTGGDLWTYCEEYKTLTEKEVVFLAYQLSLGLSSLHKGGIVHRDIKPENLLLHTGATYPRVIITDFDCATTKDALFERVSLEPGLATRDWDSFGTITYLPPEVLWEKRNLIYSDGSEAARKRIANVWFEDETGVDIWAVGCVLFRCLGGIHPFSFPKQYPAKQQVAPKEPIPDKIEPLISPSPASSALLDKRYRPDSQSIKSEPQSIDSEEARDRWEYERAMSEDGNYSDYRCRVGETMAQKQNRRATRNLIKRFKSITVDAWAPPFAWDKVSNEGKSFIAECLSYRVTDRPSCDAMREYPWIQSRARELERMWEKVVERGEAWREDD